MGQSYRKYVHACRRYIGRAARLSEEIDRDAGPKLAEKGAQHVKFGEKQAVFSWSHWHARPISPGRRPRPIKSLEPSSNWSRKPRLFFTKGPSSLSTGGNRTSICPCFGSTSPDAKKKQDLYTKEGTKACGCPSKGSKCSSHPSHTALRKAGLSDRGFLSRAGSPGFAGRQRRPPFVKHGVLFRQHEKGPFLGRFPSFYTDADGAGGILLHEHPLTRTGQNGNPF